MRIVYHLHYLFCYTIDVNKKTFIVICAALIVIACLIFWLLFRALPPGENTPVTTGDTCLILQSDDPAKPCFTAPRPVSANPVATSSVSIPTPASSTAPSVPECANGTVFEKNDCISKIVQKNGDTGLCSHVQGPIAQAACLNQKKDSMVSPAFTPPQQNSYDSYIKASVASGSQPALITAPPSPAPAPQPSTSDGSGGPVPVSAGDSYAMSPQALYERAATKAALLAYNVFPYQSRQGDIVKIQGSGFALTATNVAHIGGVEVSGLASADGMNLLATVPASASLGTNEVWVTNDRGSTRNMQRPLYAIVSENPVAPPKITGFSPANPKYTDTITLSGENLVGVKVVSTTLGFIQGESLSFRVADLDRVHLVLDQASSKGSMFPLAVFILAEGGLSEQPFMINVQF
jgi:hypothetical protein